MQPFLYLLARFNPHAREGRDRFGTPGGEAVGMFQSTRP